MPQKSAVNIVFGAANFGKVTPFDGLTILCDKPSMQHILDTFKSHGHHEIDTARRYAGGTSEEVLGELDYAKQGLIVDTKVTSGAPHSHSAENIAKSVPESLKLLQNKVHIMYLHLPDRATPFAETLGALNEEYKKGHFEKLGLSNFSAAEVEEVVKIAKEKGYVQPSVYQGNYSLAARGTEAELFPVLRKHNISFYAYSPLAGSFLTGVVTPEKRNERFDPSTFVGKLYADFFCKESYFKALEELTAVAEKHNITVPEIALRWLAHHSKLKREFGDSIIIGGKTLSNIQNSLNWLDQPALPHVVLEEVEKISNGLIKDAPKYYL